MKRALAHAVEREIDALEREVESLSTSQVSSDVEETLAPRREELEAMGPATESSSTPFELGPDLTGGAQQSISLSLDQAISGAVVRNLAVQIASLQPAINLEDVINARAAFDFVLFANVDLSKLDEPAAVRVINGVPLGTPFNASESYRYETGVRKPFDWGGELKVSTDLTRFRSKSAGVALSPDPAYTAAVRLGYAQPLLRGFGRDVNRASIRLAENEQHRSTQSLRIELLRVVAEAEIAYWNLVFAWQNLEISQWLVNEGEGVRGVLDRRRDFDTRPAQYADAVAVVEQRKANVIRARRAVRAASDTLKTLMNNPEFSVGSEVVLKPVDPLVAAPIQYELRQMLMTAIAERPEIEQSLLEIDDAGIRVLLTDNARLPLLNVSGGIEYVGLADDPDGAYDETFEADFINYLLGLAFEFPLGNRAADAGYRAARLQRAQSLLAYRRTVQIVVLEVKDALRDVVTNYELILATRSFRLAQAENLRTLLVEEETLAGLTPEFLNLKFQRQETLARARTDELQALVNFEQSLAALYRAMGTGLSMHEIEIEMVGPRASDSEYDAADY